jgi:Fic family protein
MHAQFEMIHPFRDGNGRVGRILIGLFLVSRGCLTQPVLSLSPYFDSVRSEYYARLQAISREGDWEGWVLFILEAVRVQADAALSLAQDLLRLRESLQVDLATMSAPASTLRVLELLFESPYLTVTWAARRLGVDFTTASRGIRFLEEAGVLEEVTGRERGRRFRASAVLEVLRRAEGPPGG